MSREVTFKDADGREVDVGDEVIWYSAAGHVVSAEARRYTVGFHDVLWVRLPDGCEADLTQHDLYHMLSFAPQTREYDLAAYRDRLEELGAVRPLSHNRDVYELIRTVAWNATLNVSGGIGEGERAADYVRRTLEPYVERAEAEHAAALADLAAARATIAALREAMRPALEAEARATPGEWEEHEDIDEGFWLEGAAGGIVSNDTGLHIWPNEADCSLMIAARNALPAVRALLSEEAPDGA